MREAMRLGPTAPLRVVAPLESTTLKNGTYALEKDQVIVVGTYMSQRDPKVWGPDVCYSPHSLPYELTQNALG